MIPPVVVSVRLRTLQTTLALQGDPLEQVEKVITRW